MKQSIEIKKDCQRLIVDFEKKTVTQEFDAEFKDGDFVYQKDDICEWITIFKRETEREDNILDVYAVLIGYSEYGNGYPKVRIQNTSRKVGEEGTFRLATESERQQLLSALAKEGKTWNAEKKIIEPIRWRAKENEGYYHVRILITGVAAQSRALDSRTCEDGLKYSAGDYFQTKEQAEAVADRINAIFAENL